MIGWAQLPNGDERAYIYEGQGLLRELGTLPGRIHSRALGANSAGNVVGEAYNLSTGPLGDPLRIDRRAFFHDGAAIREISPLPGTAFNTATGIDKQDRVTGLSFNQSEGGQTNVHAFLALTRPTPQGRTNLFDFDGDGRTDTALFRPTNGTWYVLGSLNNDFRARQFGTSGDLIAPEDFDGDSKTDHAVFRPANGYPFRLVLLLELRRRIFPLDSVFDYRVYDEVGRI